MTQSKTILDWLQELPEPFSSQACTHVEPDMADLPVRSCGVALSKAFDWNSTPEGIEYWSCVWSSLP